jgi:hypothetical protein
VCVFGSQEQVDKSVSSPYDPCFHTWMLLVSVKFESTLLGSMKLELLLLSAYHHHAYSDDVNLFQFKKILLLKYLFWAAENYTVPGPIMSHGREPLPRHSHFLLVECWKAHIRALVSNWLANDPNKYQQLCQQPVSE